MEGLQQLLIKTIVGEVPPLWQATLRFVGATALLWPSEATNWPDSKYFW